MTSAAALGAVALDIGHHNRRNVCERVLHPDAQVRQMCRELGLRGLLTLLSVLPLTESLESLLTVDWRSGLCIGRDLRKGWHYLDHSLRSLPSNPSVIRGSVAERAMPVTSTSSSESLIPTVGAIILDIPISLRLRIHQRPVDAVCINLGLHYRHTLALGGAVDSLL